MKSSSTTIDNTSGSTHVGITNFTRNGGGQLTHLQHLNGAGTTNLANYTYTYDAASNVLTETLGGTTTTYAYDNTNQLTSDGVTSYSYDATGNRTMTGYTTGTGNQLTNDGTWTYTYDLEGNLVKKTKGASAETWTYGYDNENHLVWAEDRATDGGTLIMRADYTYDVFGNRIETVVTGSGTGPQAPKDVRYALDGWKTHLDAWDNPATFVGLENWDIWADLTSSNTLAMRYVHGDAVDQFFARVDGSGNVAWYLTDRLGSVRDITDGSGVVQDHIDYDGFGNITNETNTSLGGRIKYTSREFDGETGLQDNRARPYNPKVGRMNLQDAKGLEAGDTNLYRYAKNDPTFATDPSGFDIKIIAVKLFRQASKPVLGIPLGPKGGPQGFFYGFNVEIHSQVSKGDRIKDAKIKQEIFLWIKAVLKSGEAKYYLLDGSHSTRTGNGQRVDEETGEAAYKAWTADKETFGDEKRKLAILFGDPNSYQNINLGRDTVEWSDAPGAHKLPASDYKCAEYRLHVKVTAQGTERSNVITRELVASMSLSSKNGTWNVDHAASKVI